MLLRAVYRNFAKGGMEKEGGGSFVCAEHAIQGDPGACSPGKML